MKTPLLACLLLLLTSMVQANTNSSPAQAEPETFQAPPATTAAAAPALRLLPVKSAARAATAAASPSNNVTLPALDDSEIQSLQNADNSKAYRVGVGRDLPASFNQPIDLGRWQWQTVSGGKVAHFSLTSTGALRVRAQLQLAKAPAGVELRFYAPANPATVFGPYTVADSTFWSPTVEGDTLGLELFLPEGVAATAVELSIPRLSHLVLNPASSQMKSSILKEEYASCQLDLACASPAWQETGKAVARYVFTDTDGLSYLCSGTLLADQDVYTQVPYFFTAAHCVSSQQAASSMDMFWLYANTSCGGSGANAVQTSGGAQLLVSKSALDTTFVRLNSNPPSGVTLSGWTTTPLSANQAVTGIHHALGHPKKYAQGKFETHARIDTASGGYSVVADANGDFSQVVWHTGITAPGSSGSGVWIEQGGVHYLNGSLLGGSSECSNKTAPDEYSRFERTWPSISSWLGASGTPPSLRLLDSNKPATALVEGVIIARYLQGVRGSALLDGVTSQTPTLATLETQLAAVQQVMDIDSDGNKDAGKDALLLMRYLLGLRGAPLVQGVELGSSKRNTAAAIATYLESILNPAS